MKLCTERCFVERNNYQAVNLGHLERVASIIGGVAAMISSVKAGKIKGALGALFAVELIRRGVTGHCLIGAILDHRVNLREQDRKLDQMLEESGPASDPSATY